jgi:hypothetical protein
MVVTVESTLLLALVGGCAGLHSACWGAFKDSPYEPFLLRKFLRSIFLGLLAAYMAGVFLASLGITALNLGVVYAVVVVMERAVTELGKSYFRNEPQGKYKIPSQAHILGKVVKSSLWRMLLGLGYTIAFIIFTLAVFAIPQDYIQNSLLAGMLFGLAGGLLMALGGGLKDAPIEGFDLVKFMRSPFVGLAAGGVLSAFTPSYGVIMLASMGTERMITEAYKTFVKKSTPGKFKALEPAFPAWIERRMIFIIPYFATWIVFLLAFTASISL